MQLGQNAVNILSYDKVVCSKVPHTIAEPDPCQSLPALRPQMMNPLLVYQRLILSTLWVAGWTQGKQLHC